MTHYQKLEKIIYDYKEEQDFNNLASIVSGFNKDNLMDAKTFYIIDSVAIKLNAIGILNILNKQQSLLQKVGASNLLESVNKLSDIIKQTLPSSSTNLGRSREVGHISDQVSYCTQFR